MPSLTTVVFCALGAQGGASFDAARIFPSPSTHWPAGLADLDGDGHLDAVTLSQKEIGALLGDGAGGFTAVADGTQLSSYSQTDRRQPGLADVDGDGRIDAVVTGEPFLQPVELQLLRGRGDGTFQPPLECGSSPGSVAAPAITLQWDGGADHEVAWVRSEASGNVLELYAYASGCLQRVAMGPAIPEAYITTIYGADLDADGLDELVLHDQWFHRVFVVEDLGGGPVVTATLDIPQPLGPGVSTIAVGDVEGDADVDVVVVHLREEPFVGVFWSVTVLANDGTGALTPLPTSTVDLPNGAAIHGPALEVVDWDGDGLGDLVGKPDVWPLGTVGATNGRVLLLRHVGGGVFDGIGEWPDLSMTRVAGAADLDGDGLPEIVSKVVVPGDGAFEDRTAAPFFGYNRDHQVHDFDRDGDVDLHVASSLVAGAFYWANDATGQVINKQVAPGLALFPGEYLIEPVRGDLDGDGLEELVMEAWLSSGSPFLPDTFLGLKRFGDATGNGYELLGPAADPALTWLDEPSLVADLNADGHRDVADGDSVWYGDGSGQLAAPASLFPGGRIVAAGDVEPDGDQDLLVTYDAGGALETRLKRYDNGIWSDQLLTAVSSPWSSPELLDLDGDGDLDAAVPRDLGSGLTEEDIVVFENASGSFHRVAAPTVLLYAAVHDLAVDDVDGDGWLDLLALANGIGSDPSYGRLAVLRRSGPGWAYASGEGYLLIQGSGLADADADGDVDVFGAVTTRGLRFQPPEGGGLRQYSGGSIGSGGAFPLLGGTGPLTVGSSQATVRISRGVGGAVGVLGLGSAQTLQPGVPVTSVTLLVELPLLFAPILLDGPAGAAGQGDLELALPISPVLAGTSVFAQAFLIDPGAPDLISATNGVEASFAP